MSFEHNMWNPLIELVLKVQISGAFEDFDDEIDLAKISLSFNFVLDFSYEEGVQDSA